MQQIWDGPQWINFPPQPPISEAPWKTLQGTLFSANTLKGKVVVFAPQIRISKFSPTTKPFHNSNFARSTYSTYNISYFTWYLLNGFTMSLLWSVLVLALWRPHQIIVEDFNEYWYQEWYFTQQLKKKKRCDFRIIRCL